MELDPVGASGLGASVEPECETGKCPAGADLDPVCALEWEFREGLRELYDPTLTFSFSKEFNRRWAAHQHVMETYCLRFLERLNEQERSGEPGVEVSAIQVARIAVRLELTRIRRSERSPDELEALFHEALADAMAARRRSSVHGVLIELGHFRREQGRLAEAESYYKDALVYADNSRPYFEVPRVFYWLGVTLATQEISLSEAVLMFDCASRFGPIEFQSLVEKQKCRLRLGDRDALLAEMELSADAGVLEIAAGIAAAVALGRRKKRIRDFALLGVEAAVRDGKPRWQVLFARLAQ